MEGPTEQDEEDDVPTNIPSTPVCTFLKRRKQNKGFLRSTTRDETESKKTSKKEPSSIVPHYDSNKAITKHDQGATARAGVDAPKNEDHRAVLERNAELGQAILDGKIEPGIYRGQGAYAPVTKVREGAIAAGKYTGLYGPVRGIDNVRMTMRIDYDPCICKDYKETGYCGFGDSCKFLHDRTDYKGGWQIEKEWDETQKKKQNKLDRVLKRKYGASDEEDDDKRESPNEGDSDSNEVELPFACLSCRAKWNSKSNPIVTQCDHYFCENCAVKNHAKSTKCPKCGKNTGGIFNVATKIVEKINILNTADKISELTRSDNSSASDEGICADHSC